MIRKELSADRPGGRRPLLVTFVGNNRQMLNEIRDSLSHLRKHDLEGFNDVSGMQLKTELSQSTPNLLDQKSATGSKMTRRDNQHHKALAEIRDSLRPYQNHSQVIANAKNGGAHGGSSSGSVAPISSAIGAGYQGNHGSGGSDNGSTGSMESESYSSKIQAIMRHGFDEVTI